MKRKHKDEEEVVLALKLPKKDQEKAFGALKREGIFMANMKRLESDKSAPLIKERSQRAADTVLCSGCRGFYDAKSIFKHKRLCEKNVSDLSKTLYYVEKALLRSYKWTFRFKSGFIII